MFNSLLYIGLCATAFVFFPGLDIRELKMTSAIIFALGLCMAEFYLHGLKPIKNIWVYILLAYIPVAIFLSPAPQIDLVGINVMGFWSWQPFVKMMVFGLLFLVIASHEFKNSDIKTLLNVIVWCGFITGAYEIMQFFFADQFFAMADDGNWGRIAGFIGNPTLTAPYVAMIFPIALYLRKYFMASIIFIGAILPDSQMTWIALAAGIIIYFALKGPKWFVAFSSICILSVIAFILLYLHNQSFRNVFSDHERFLQWKAIFKDWIGPLSPQAGVTNNFSLTGRGMGSFRFVYHLQHPEIGSPNRFHQAHNDFLEFGYCEGFLGIGFLGMAIFTMIKNNISIRSIFTFGEERYKRALISSIATICVAAIGTFVFQIGTMAFLTVVIAGLLHNQNLNKELI